MKSIFEELDKEKDNIVNRRGNLTIFCFVNNIFKKIFFFINRFFGDGQARYLYFKKQR
jgi:hypothetical protein